MRPIFTLRILSFSAVLVLAACQSSGSVGQAPSWFVAYHAEGSVEAVYPKEKNIALIGSGESREAARANAVAEISRYFSQKVKASISSWESLSETNSSTFTDRGINTRTFVLSQAELSTVRYSEPWQNRQEKQWEIVAYINREEAWAVYEPRLRSVAASFMTAYEAAGAADDPLSQYSRYRASLRLANEENGAADMLAYAQALYPEKAREFAAAQNALAGIPAKIQAVLDWALITVRCDNDFENIVTGAIIEAFRQGGFKTAGSASRGTNRAEAAIDEGMQTLEAGTFYAPRITLTISGEGKTLFTWTANAARQGAWDVAVAKRQSWNALALKIKESLLREFNAAMEGGIK
jgi:hypothetical protein